MFLVTYVKKERVDSEAVVELPFCYTASVVSAISRCISRAVVNTDMSGVSRPYSRATEQPAMRSVVLRPGSISLLDPAMKFVGPSA
jgi:hypothetical protein